MTLQGCQILNVAPAEGQLGSSAIEVAPPPEDAGYPRLRSVPPRPQLSYPVEQRREVVEGLISDRENARYTGQTVRYRTGQSDLPPPPRPVAAPVEAAQAIVQAPSPGEPPPPERPIAQVEEDVLSDDSYRTLSEGEAELDDGSLNDFIRDLVRDTGPPEAELPIIVPAPGTTVAPGGGPPATATAEQAASPPDAEPQGPVQRFVGWLGGLFERDDGASAAEPSSEPAGESAAPEQHEPDQPADRSEVPPGTARPAPPKPPQIAESQPRNRPEPADAPTPGPTRAELQPPIEPSPPAPRAEARAVQ